MIPIEAILDRAGRSPLRLTPLQDSARWTTVAMGGFGSCSFRLPGEPARWKREIPHLARLRLILDTQVIWEGELEDIDLVLGGEEPAAEVQAFGLRRLLDRESVRRIWSKRDIEFVRRSATQATPDDAFEVATGTFDASDLTKVGVQIAGNGGTTDTSHANQMLVLAPDGLSFVRVICTKEKAGNANLRAEIRSSADGINYTSHISETTNETATEDVALVANAIAILFGETVASAFAAAVSDYVRFYNIRVLGTSLTEDVAGGFYGGTILRDLIALVPGLSIGIIDTGSDFTIQSIERAVRSAAASVVQEVAGYYTREWGVWEEGRFDWKAVNRDEPQWIAQASMLQDGSRLRSTVDGLAQDLYVLYTDAASGREAEASATSSDQRNPFVKQGKESDVTVQPGFPMTSASAAQLASRLVAEQGAYPLVEGRLVLSATATIKRASGSPLPAFMIRAGENVVVPDLPKTDLFQTGRDGETLFHIVSTEADLSSGRVTLEVEGQSRRADVLLARLAAVTRTLTG